MIFVSQRGFEKRLIAAMKAEGSLEMQAILLEKALAGQSGARRKSVERKWVAMVKRWHGTPERFIEVVTKQM